MTLGITHSTIMLGGHVLFVFMLSVVTLSVAAPLNELCIRIELRLNVYVGHSRRNIGSEIVLERCTKQKMERKEDKRGEM